VPGCRRRDRRQHATSPCRPSERRQGPHLLTPTDGVTSQGTCRLWWRRQGGCRVWRRRQGGCRHWWRRQVVLFGKNFERWSFLTLRWRRWSLLSKIQSKELQRNCTTAVHLIHIVWSLMRALSRQVVLSLNFIMQIIFTSLIPWQEVPGIAPQCCELFCYKMEATDSNLHLLGY
jgi:hypothetical protein